MTPQQFLLKMASESRSDRLYLLPLNVYRPRWFRRVRNYRRPRATDMRHLALMDFLVEHYEDIPEDLLNLLCFPKHNP
jgi:hypothetical protein